MSQWELTTELLVFETTKKFQKDPTVVEPAFDLVLSAEGTHQWILVLLSDVTRRPYLIYSRSRPGYYGKQIENASTGYIFCRWDSYEAHEKVLQSDLFPKVKEALLETSFVTWGAAQMYHVIFSDEPIALERPVTEVTLLTLKAPENRDAMVGILTQISERFRERFRNVFGIRQR